MVSVNMNKNWSHKDSPYVVRIIGFPGTMVNEVHVELEKQQIQEMYVIIQFKNAYY